MRIIGGQWRGRKIPIVDSPGLRPSLDGVRERLFNWLQGELYGARVLDLFAGTGALGLEALSRGATEATFVEKSSQVATHLHKVVNQLQAPAEVRNQAAEDFVGTYCSGGYDIIFLDPPFGLYPADYWPQELLKNNCLNDQAWLYIETEKAAFLPQIPGFETYRHKISRHIGYGLFRYEA